MFETLRDLFLEFEALFSDQFSVSLRNEAITIWKRLGEEIRRIFMELENLIPGIRQRLQFLVADFIRSLAM